MEVADPKIAASFTENGPEGSLRTSVGVIHRQSVGSAARRDPLDREEFEDREPVDLVVVYDQRHCPRQGAPDLQSGASGIMTSDFSGLASAR